MQKNAYWGQLFAILDSEERAMDKTYKDSVLMDLTIIMTKIDNKETDKGIRYITLKYNTRWNVI